MFLIACSKDDNSSQGLIRKIYRDYDTIEYSYTGSQVIRKQRIYQGYPIASSIIDYHYTGGKIDCTMMTYPIPNTRSTIVYHFHADTLKSILSRGRDQTTYILYYDEQNHVSALRQSYFIYGSHGEFIFVNHLYQFIYQNGNIVTCLEFNGTSSQSADTIRFTYDDKKNPFSISIDPDISFYPFNWQYDFRYFNKNNILTETHVNPYASYISATYSYTYNSKGYPVTQKNSVYDWWGNLSTLTIRYEYIE